MRAVLKTTAQPFTMLEISKKLATCLNVVKKYEWLLDSYVLVCN